MSFTFAYECYADGDIVLFLRDHCGLTLRKLHSFGQGEVVNDLLERSRADIGMVDEDPGKSHHPLRDQMQVIHTTNYVEMRGKSGRYLLVLKPELEDSFLNSMRRAGLKTKLPSDPKDLQKVLNLPNHPSHMIFREELADLRTVATTQNVSTFITDIEGIIRKLGSQATSN